MVRGSITRKGLTISVLTTLMMMMLSGSSEAFWWLFGRTQEEVHFTYLYVNNVPFDETGESVTLYKSFMPDGMVHIRGRAVAGRGRIGSVMVSFDGKQTWREAKVSDNGAFEFSFRPEVGRTYHVYVEAMETAGRTNDIDETYKAVTVSDSDIRERVVTTLDRLFNAYTRRNAGEFMELVSPQFTGDRFLLERAVLDDFRFFNDIQIRHSLESVSTDADGRAFALVSYDRSVVAKTGGKTYRDSGVTGFSFNPEDGELKIYMMRHPVIFGVSGATDIASGVISAAENQNVIIVDKSGGISLGEPDSDASGDYEQGTFTLRTRWTGGNKFDGYIFSTGSVVTSIGWDWPIEPDLMMEENIFFIHWSVRGQELDALSVDLVKQVPEEGYHELWDVEPGRCYALFFEDENAYGVLQQITEVRYYNKHGQVVPDFEHPEDGYTEAKFAYKYRSDGSRNF